MRGHLIALGAPAIIVDLSPGDRHLSAVGYLLRRSAKWLAGLARFGAHLMRDRWAACYFAVSGGKGQLLDLPFLAAARALRRRIVIHHHSFAYVDRRSRVAALLFAIGGRGARHVTLCDAMAAALQARYPVIGSTLVLSNAAVLGVPDSAPRAPGSLRRIGYLSNISREKGIDTFLSVVAALRRARNDVEAVIAGPFADQGGRDLVEQAIARDPAISYVGPVYDAAKAAFFERIDCLLLPTRYRNEAEPLVLHEALGAGLPVVATARGCICNVMSGGAGIAIGEGEKGIAQALQALEGWMDDPESYRRAAHAAAVRFAEMQSAGQTTLEMLLHDLTGLAPKGNDAAPVESASGEATRNRLSH